MKFFVHRYDVVRIKVCVEAETQIEAMKKADEFISDFSPIRDVDFQPPLDVCPIFCGSARAEETRGYLVDVVGDEEYENSRSYDPNYEEDTVT